MIELVVRNFLSEETGIACYLEEPEEKPDAYIVIVKTGSAEENFIKKSTLAIKSYAKTLLESAETNEKIKKVMHKLENQDPVCRVSLNSDYNYTDTSTKRHRYQAVFDVTHY